MERNKYFRINDEIGRVIGILSNGNLSTTKGVKGQHQMVKLADTPQELIQVGDLVSCSRYYDLPSIIDEEDYEQLLEEYWQPFITKIYTPNEDKSQYTIQWEKNNENNI